MHSSQAFPPIFFKNRDQDTNPEFLGEIQVDVLKLEEGRRSCYNCVYHVHHAGCLILHPRPQSQDKSKQRKTKLAAIGLSLVKMPTGTATIPRRYAFDTGGNAKQSHHTNARGAVDGYVSIQAPEQILPLYYHQYFNVPPCLCHETPLLKEL